MANTTAAAGASGSATTTATTPESDKSEGGRPMRLRLDAAATDVPEMLSGFGEVGLDWRVPASEKFDIYVGPALRLMLPFGEGYASDQLTQQDVDTGVTQRLFSPLWGVGAGGHAEGRYKLGKAFSLGLETTAGIAYVSTRSTGAKLTGDQYNTIVCGPNGTGGGISGDVTGTCSQSAPSFAQAGADNNTVENQGGANLFWSVGPTLAVQANDVIQIRAGGGLNGLAAMSGPAAENPVGWYGGLGVALALGTPEKKKVNDSDRDGIMDNVDACPNTPTGVKVDKTGCPLPEADDDKDGVPNSKDKCPGTKKGDKVDTNGCSATQLAAGYKVAVLNAPKSVRPEERFLLDLRTDHESKVTVVFVDEKKKATNANTVMIEKGDSQSEFKVPAGLTVGKYKMNVIFTNTETRAEKTEEREVVIVENVTATLPGSFAPGQPPTIQDATVVGQDKLEGVTYTIEAFSKDAGSALGKADVTNKPTTLESGKGKKIALSAPDLSIGGKTKKGWQKDVNYVVTLRNKEGLTLWQKSFEIGAAAAGKGGRKRL